MKPIILLQLGFQFSTFLPGTEGPSQRPSHLQRAKIGLENTGRESLEGGLPSAYFVADPIGHTCF